MSASDKSYIGDGVYVEFTSGMLKLTTENGIETANTIWLEPSVWVNLAGYVQRLQDEEAKRKD
jgi:hypothetical protein